MSREDDRLDRRQRALIQAGVTLASDLSLPSVLQKIVDLACEVADARYGALGVLHPDRRTIVRFITHGVTEEERRAIGPLPQGKGILGVLIDEARPLRLDRIQDDPRSVGFPPHHPRMERFLGVPVMIHGRVFGNLYLTEKRGGAPFSQEDEEAVKILATQAAVAIENARLYEGIRARQDRLEAVNEVTRRILEGRPTQDVLVLIAERARSLAGAALATVVTPDPEGQLLVRVAVGERADAVRGERFPLENSISGEVMRTRSPLSVDDIAADPRVSQPAVRAGGLGPALFLPLAVEDRAFGTLLVANPTGAAPFDRDDLEIVSIFSAQASVALEYARIREELSRLAVLEDRERIAQELHDGVIQSLFAVGMSLQVTESMAADPDAVRQRIETAVDAIDRAIRDLRNYIFGLRPGAVADRNLSVALEELVGSFGEGSGLAIDHRIDPEAAALLSPRAADVVQAAREAISNAVRHSGGGTIELRLVLDGGAVLLEVRDDGAGFDPEEAAGKGQGLSSLRSRATALGGSFELASGPEGTLVRLRIPL
jgi:signal transduction histidine kinase